MILCYDFSLNEKYEKYEKYFISSWMSSCLDINISDCIFYKPDNIFELKLPQISTIDEIIGKIFILERNYKTERSFSKKIELYTRYMILRTTRMDLNFKGEESYTKYDLKINQTKNKKNHLDCFFILRMQKRKIKLSTKYII